MALPAYKRSRARPKTRFFVYARTIQFYDCIPQYSEWRLVGETFAVSEAQAINNIRFRLRQGTDFDIYVSTLGEYCDCGGDSYSRETEYKATTTQKED